MTRLVALLPMKGHSERVPNKNLREFNGRPLCHWMLNTLTATPEVDGILVDTDASEIATEARRFDATVVERPEGLHRLATGIASRIPFLVPMPLRRTYDNATRSPAGTGRDGVSVDSTTGIHSNPAAWALAGPDVGTGGPREIRFEDLPPTILALLGESVPEAYVGSAVDAVPTPRVEDRSLAVGRETHIGDDEVVSERLHDLGYAEMVDED